jgi:hypothetical protein
MPCRLDPSLFTPASDDWQTEHFLARLRRAFVGAGAPCRKERGAHHDKANPL